MIGSRILHSTAFVVAYALGAAGCGSDATWGEGTGALGLSLEVDGVTVDAVSWVITSEGMEPMDGTIDLSGPESTPSVEVFGLIPGSYTVTLLAGGTDGQSECDGSESFAIEAGQVTDVMVVLRCKSPDRLGSARVNGELNICAELTKMVVSPLEAAVGGHIKLKADTEDEEGDPIAFEWTATGGSIAEPNDPETTYTCEQAGNHTITVTVTDDEGHCEDRWTVDVTCTGAACPCFTLADVLAIAEDPSCDPICVEARPTALKLTALQCSVTQFDYSAVVEEFTDFGGEPLCQLNLPLADQSVLVLGLAESEVLACRNLVLEAASIAGLDCR